jgi:hypothetical protein
MGTDGRRVRDNKPRWVREWILKYNYMSYANVFKRSSILVHKNLIYLVQGIKALDNMSKYSVFPIEVFNAF